MLITGASGFLGGYAVREFAAHGHDVIATGRNQDALDELAADTHGNAVTVHAGSLHDLETARLPVDTVVHAAALSSVWGRWRAFEAANVDGTESVVRFVGNNAVRRVVFVSSPSIYAGREHRHAITEDDYDDDNRLSPYIRSKLRAEQILRTAHADGRIPELTIIRPRGLVGAGDPSMAPRLIRANQTTGIPLFNDGQNMVDLTCVENAATALRLAAESTVADGATYNVTNGEPRTFRSVLEELFEILGETPRYKHANVRLMYGLGRLLETAYAGLPGSPEPPLTRYTVSTLAYSQTLDISKVVDQLGYEPKVGLSEGLQRFAKHYLAQNAGGQHA